MSALDELLAQGLKPSPDGESFLRRCATLSDAWDTSPDGIWLGWYLSQAYSRLSQDDQGWAHNAVDRAVLRCKLLQITDPEKFELAQNSENAAFGCRLLWAHASVGLDPSYPAMAASVIRRTFPVLPGLDE